MCKSDRTDRFVNCVVNQSITRADFYSVPLTHFQEDDQIRTLTRVDRDCIEADFRVKSNLVAISVIWRYIWKSDLHIF